MTTTASATVTIATAATFFALDGLSHFGGDRLHGGRRLLDGFVRLFVGTGF